MKEEENKFSVTKLSEYAILVIAALFAVMFLVLFFGPSPMQKLYDYQNTKAVEAAKTPPPPQEVIVTLPEKPKP